MEWIIDILVGWVAGSIVFGIVADLFGLPVPLMCLVGVILTVGALRWRRHLDEKNAW